MNSYILLRNLLFFPFKFVVFQNCCLFIARYFLYLVIGFLSIFLFFNLFFIFLQEEPIGQVDQNKEFIANSHLSPEDYNRYHKIVSSYLPN